MDREPTLKEIQRYVVPGASEVWEELGIELELDDDGTIVDQIRQERGGNKAKCCLDVVKTWRKGTGMEPKTWGTLLKCLRAVSGAEAAITSIQENIFDARPQALSGATPSEEQQQKVHTLPNISPDPPQPSASTAKNQPDTRSHVSKLEVSSDSEQPTQRITRSKAKMAEHDPSPPPKTPGASAANTLLVLDYSLRLEPPHRVRNYQWELAEPGIVGLNYIVCAPTGTGKTLVAALIISKHLQGKRGKGKVVFVVNTKILAQQQKDEIQKFVPGASVECCTGDDANLTVQLLLGECDIVVCTAGKFLDEIRRDMVHFTEFSLMFFDECHHTHKETPYANIMAQYLEEAAQGGRLPQVIGMTASPGAGTRNPDLEKTLDHLITLCALLNATGGIRIVKENIAELDSFTNKPKFHLQVFDRRDSSDPFIHHISVEMNRLEGFTELHCPFDRWSQEYETSIQQKKGFLEMSARPENRDYITALEMLRHFSLVLSIYMDLRHEDAISVLNKYSLPATKQASLFDKEMSGRLMALKSQLSKVPKTPNPLLSEVEGRVCDKFSQKPDSRGIIFVRTKQHAACICDWAAQLPIEIGVKPVVITGHTRDTGLGMTEVEQTQVIQGFQEGEYNLLVATSVAEEGLDVPACNFVIRFQHVSNEIAKKQTLGRARASGAEGFTILSSDSKKKYQEIRNAELEAVVEQALHLYFPEGGTLTKQLGERQKELISVRVMKQELRAERRAANSRENVRLLCKKCKEVACHGTDIYTVENETHYVVANEEFRETKIVKKLHRTPTAISEKVSKTHKIHCAKCNADWGVMFTWPSHGWDFPILKCSRFIFEVNGTPQAVKKWSNAPFDIPPLSSRPEYQLID